MTDQGINYMYCHFMLFRDVILIWAWLLDRLKSADTTMWNKTT